MKDVFKICTDEYLGYHFLPLLQILTILVFFTCLQSYPVVLFSDKIPGETHTDRSALIKASFFQQESSLEIKELHFSDTVVSGSLCPVAKYLHGGNLTRKFWGWKQRWARTTQSLESSSLLFNLCYVKCHTYTNTENCIMKPKATAITQLALWQFALNFS